MEDPKKQSDGASKQGSLFDLPATEPTPRIRPWRPIEVGNPAASEEGLQELLALHVDLLRRDRQFMKALRIAGVSEDAPGVVRFLETEAILTHGMIALKWDQVQAIEVPEVLAVTREAEQGLARLRRELLAELSPAQRDRALAAEPRIRPSDVELFRDIAALEFRLAEKTGQIVTLELELDDYPGAETGVLGPDAAEALAEAYMHQQRTEQERKPLPVRPRLRTLLKRLPVVWLDPICNALGLKRERHRRNRELAVAEILIDPSKMQRLLDGVLGEDERNLLSYLLGKGGMVKASAVTRAYGSDEADGWFWDERPPTSSLGRLRLHGLVFVGSRADQGRRYRTVVVPEELRETIRGCLEGH